MKESTASFRIGIINLIGKKMATYDICVFGGGPAGTTIARNLHVFGYKVLLVEKLKAPQQNIGLSLSPGVNHWLELLDLKQSINSAGFNRGQTSWLLWESSEVQIKYNDNPGYHVDRALFDTILQDAVVNSGVKILHHCDVKGMLKDNAGNWNIELNQNGTKLSIFASFIVDATGRKGILKGTKRSFQPTTLAVYGFGKGIVKNRNISFIEAGNNHFYWGTDVCSLGFMTCIFTDPDQIKQYETPRSFYLNTIRKSVLHAVLCRDFTQDQDRVSVCTATPVLDSEPVSDNYIKIGDAAFCTDPLSSQGIQKAFKEGFQGAIVVNTILNKNKNRKLAIGYYADMIEREAKKSAVLTRRLYANQQLFEVGDFWRRRKMSHTEKPLYAQINVTVKYSDILSISKNARITEVPIVTSAFIEAGQGIFTDASEDPFVFLQDRPIIPLIKKHTWEEFTAKPAIHSGLPTTV